MIESIESCIFVIVMLWNTRRSGIFIFWPSCITLYNDKWFHGLDVLTICKLDCLNMDRDVVESWVPCAEMAREEFLYEKKKCGDGRPICIFLIDKIDYCLDLSDVVVWVKDTKLVVTFSFKNLFFFGKPIFRAIFFIVYLIAFKFFFNW